MHPSSTFSLFVRSEAEAAAKILAAAAAAAEEGGREGGREGGGLAWLPRVQAAMKM